MKPNDTDVQESSTTVHTEVEKKAIETRSATSSLWKILLTKKADAQQWVKYGSNTIADGTEFTEIAVNSDDRGAYLFLDNLATLEDNKNYKVTLKAYATNVNTNSSLQMFSEGNSFIGDIIGTAEKGYELKAFKEAGKKLVIRFSGLPTGSKVYVSKNINIYKMRDRTYAQPLGGARFKGATIDITNPKDASVIQEWFTDLDTIGVKTIRVQVNPKDGNMNGLSKAAFLADVVNRFNADYLPLIQQYGMNVIFGMESIPYDDPALNNRRNSGYWENPQTKQNFIDTADYIANAFKNTSEIFALQFMSEPVDSANKLPQTWNDISNSVLTTVRNYTDKFIVWSPVLGGLVNKYDLTVPLDDDKIIYNFHTFRPMSYTHQGIGTRPNNVPYSPVTLSNIGMDAVIAFKTNNPSIPVMCGSYSLANWISDADQWVNDMHAIFDTNNISTIQFATGQFKGWDWRFIGTVDDSGRKLFIYDASTNNKLWTKLSQYLRKQY